MTATPDSPLPGPARRDVVRGAAAGAAVATATVAPFATSPAQAATTTGFLHGVASGDPLPTAVVLWTRVTPTADATPGSGRGARVTVTWEVATDASFRTVVRRGSMTTGTERDHTVKVDATGLTPATRYAYRFRSGGSVSPTGWTKTAPAAGSTPSRLRLGVVSCSNWEAGYFAAYRHLAAHQGLDAVLHMGDYLYEYPTGEYGAAKGAVRTSEPAHEIVTLADYRIRHGHYKTDPDLQALHAAAAWITTWDDHESANDAWIGGAENHDPLTEGRWRDRAAAARRAYDEWMPIRLSGTAAIGDGSQIFRQLSFGTLADLRMLDLRTYRSEQASAARLGAVGDADRTITGDAQMTWLKQSLSRSTATWKLVGNPVMIAPVTFGAVDVEVGRALHDMGGVLPPEGIPYNVDQWDGYTADRRELIDHIADHAIDNTVFLTGDIHSAWACDIPKNVGTYPLSRSVAVEFVGTSVTSNNLDDILKVEPRTLSLAVEGAIRGANLHVRYLDFDRHGYSVLTLTPARAQMDWYALADRTNRQSTARWSAGFETLPGTNRVRRVWKAAS
ncbi:alkaline phosphatase D family protein [Janibacter hoylei]|uniref:alkaline phosphatase D family protein n=1 Tax=Janibacter hoylei TaxID=364298 RepID=UPI0022382796|nr:alkaline phosphatase D family protein [Janibacter hoylei]MCW4600766.1 alkaline phosphatase D family protein [Janibacter hoylei]